MDTKEQNNSVETINDRNWNILLDAIDRERVVPIIGDEFFFIKDEESGTDMRIDAFLIKELSRKFNINDEVVDFTTITDTIDVENFKNRRNAGKKTDLYFEIDSILRTTRVRCRSNIEDFLAIGKFPLILTTSYVPGLESSLFATFGNVVVKVYDKSNRNDIDGTLSALTPTLYYLFGKESRINKSYKVTDDDFLDYLHMWHNTETRPEKISKYLSGKFLLLLGCNYPNWLFRFFWHSIRNFSLSSATSEMQGVVTRTKVGEDKELMRFLSRIQTEIFENGSVFINEFMDRWEKRQIQKPNPTIGTDDSKTKNDEIDVFISYADEDREKAAYVAEKLESLGAKTWFDKRELKSSDLYETIIEEKISKAKRFMPIISHTTLVPGRRFFRKEWAMAIREMDFRYGLPYFAPVVIDDSNINSEQIPKPFRDAHAINIDAEDCEMQLKKLIRSFR